MSIISWPLLPIFLILLVSALLALIIVGVALRRKQVVGARLLALLMLAVSEWALMSALEKAFVAQDAKVLCSKFQYLGVVSVVPLLLLFILQYIHQEHWLAWPRQVGLWVLPAITVVMAFTNDWHGLLWAKIYPAEGGLPGLLVYEHGPWFWVIATYSYLLMFVSSGILVWAYLRLDASYRRQVGGLLLAGMIPWASNALYLARLIWPRGFDPTPVSFTLTGLVMAWTLFRFRLLDLVPIALETVVENMSDGMLVLDGRGRVVEINPAARALLGLGDRLVVGQKAAVLFNPWPALAECCQEQEMQAEIVVETDSSRTVDVRVAPLRGRLGQTLGQVVSLRDITQRKRTETESLIRSAALRAAANGITITDRDGTILWVNPAFTRMTGYAAEEVVGRKPDVLKSGVHGPEYYRNLWETILAGNTWHGETVNRRKDGSLYTEEQTITPVRNEQGEITYFISIKQDISERKALEQFRDDMTYTMVHDLRNPLASIIFALELMGNPGMSAGPDSTHQEVMNVAQKSAERMRRLLNSILDISRLENGQVPLQRETVALAGLVSEAISLQMPLAASKNLALTANLPADLPPVRVDASLVGRVLQNLVDNAIKFSPQGSRVTVSARHDAAEQLVLVTVQDSGPGLAPDVRSRLFQKYAAGATAGRGTGLGLAFCRLAVEAHGGGIWVEEGTQPGTAFTFSLPL